MKRIVFCLLAVVLCPAFAPAADAISWLPGDAHLVVKLSGSDPKAPAAAGPLAELLAFVAGSEPLLSALPANASSLVFGEWSRDGQSRRVAVVSGTGLELPALEPGLVAAAVAPGVFVVGSPESVGECVSGGGGNLLLPELEESIESGSGARLAAWLWASRPWLRPEAAPDAWPSWTTRAVLQRLRSSTLQAFSEGEKVAFEVSTAAGDARNARLLAAELKAHLRQIGPGDESPLQQSLDEAQVSAERHRVSLQITLAKEMLEPLTRSQTVAQLLRWQLNSATREERERIPELARLMELGKGSRVADIGAGSGFLSVRLARLVGEEGKVWAVDISERALEALNGRLDRDLYPQLETVLGAEDDPRLEPESLDAAVIVNAYHEMPEHREMLARIKEALKPGGRFLLLEPFSLETRGQSREQQVESHHFAPELLVSELEEAGFEIAHREDEFVRPDADSPQRNCLVVARKP